MFQFEDIIGQNDVKSALVSQAKSGKLHHAHLFLGKMGYGTFQLAMAFLKYIYCENKLQKDSCNACANCLKINKLSHIDIHFTIPSFKIEALSERIIPDFRKIIDEKSGLFDIKDWHDFNDEKNSKIRSAECDVILNNLSLSSYQDGYKSQVIWMAESLEKESNKILKILEEPNPNTLFILIAESSDNILPTILSRCNIHRILPLKDEEVKLYIESRNITKSKEELIRSIHFSEGDIIESNRYLEDEESEFPLEINLLNFLRGLINFHERKFTNINKVIKQSEALASQSKSNQKKFLDYFQYFIRQVVLLKISGECQLNESLIQAANYFASLMEIDQLETWSQIIDASHQSIEGNANVKISFVSLAIESGKIQNRMEYNNLVYKYI